MDIKKLQQLTQLDPITNRHEDYLVAIRLMKGSEAADTSNDGICLSAFGSNHTLPADYAFALFGAALFWLTPVYHLS